MSNHHVGGPDEARYQRERAVLKQRAMEEGLTCCHCDEPFAWDVNHYHPLSFTIEHIVQISHGGLRADPTNMEIAHLRCNQWRGTNPNYNPDDRPNPTVAYSDPEPLSEEWT